MKLGFIIPGLLLKRGDDGVSPKAIDVDLVLPRIPRPDLYLSPLKVTDHEFRTFPSNRHATSWVPISSACSATANNTGWDFIDACADGHLLNPSRLSIGNASVTHVLDSEANYYADVVEGVAPSIAVGGSVVEKFHMGFAKATNASFGVMGLGRQSGLLDRLKEEGKIGVKGFSLWAGSDVKYRQNWDPKAENRSYPGSLVLGGYDFAKQEGDDFLRGSLVDGMPRIQLTGIRMQTPADQELMGVSDEPLDVEIDSSLPWIYLPSDLAARLKNQRENTVKDDGTLTRERILGNITMTVRLPKAQGSAEAKELKLTFPESIWDENYSYITHPKPSFKTFMPVMAHSGAPPAIFGRAFLKAVYLSINYEYDQFQISPASYSSKKNIQPFVPGGSAWPVKGEGSGVGEGGRKAASPLTIGSTIGGVLLAIVIVAAIGLLYVKRKEQARKRSREFGYSDLPSLSSRSKPAGKQHPKPASPSPGGQAGFLKVGRGEASGDLADRSTEALLTPPGHYEYGGYYHNKHTLAPLDATTQTYPATYVPHNRPPKRKPLPTDSATLRSSSHSSSSSDLTPPDGPNRPLDISSGGGSSGSVGPPRRAARSPVAPFSPFSPYATVNLWRELPLPEHLRVHEMP